MVKKTKSELSRIAKRAARARRQNEDKEKKKQRAILATKNRREKTGGHTAKRQELKRKVMLAYSKKYLKKNSLFCFCCRKRLHLDFLTIDHVKGRKEMEKDRHLKKMGIGVLITDHNVRETLKITDRAYIINNGEILRSGAPAELSMDPQVRKIYLGEDFTL